MPKIPVYKCCICHRVLTNESTVRIQECIYGAGKTGGHYPVFHYDFCFPCYHKITKWIKKHQEENNDN